MDALLVLTIVLVQAGRRVRQLRGEDEALQAAPLLRQGQVVDLDSRLALSATLPGVAHTLVLADRITLATAGQCGVTIWTMDQDFAGLPRVRWCAKRRRAAGWYCRCRWTGGIPPRGC